MKRINSNTPSLSDFPENIQKGFVNNDFNPETAKEIINDNFVKGRISEDLFCESMEIVDFFEKGKRAEIGEIREFGTKKYKKGENSWEAINEE